MENWQAVVAYNKLVFHQPGRTEENHNNFGQTNRPPGRESSPQIRCTTGRTENQMSEI
jgi:hypothetical protein